jgi:hypothetical protein
LAFPLWSDSAGKHARRFWRRKQSPLLGKKMKMTLQIKRAYLISSLQRTIPDVSTFAPVRYQENPTGKTQTQLPCPCDSSTFAKTIFSSGPSSSQNRFSSQEKPQVKKSHDDIPCIVLESRAGKDVVIPKQRM